MNRKFSYSFADKVSFYLSYLYYKVILPFEVSSPRVRLWWYEFRYSIAKFKDYESNVTWKYAINTIKTKFGLFKIRPNTSDAANVSPAFERRDQNYLIRLIDSKIRENKKVLFLDVGGDLGSYSVLVGNAFRGKPVTIHCFEPIDQSCLLIKENIALNSLEKSVEVFPVALLNEDKDNVPMQLNTMTPGSSTMKPGEKEKLSTVTITTRKLDTLLNNQIAAYDTIVFKIDVEGVEQEVIEGAQKIISQGKEVYVMVEDFIKSQIITYLETQGWSFLAKVTSYNSWWLYQPKPNS